MKHSSTISTVTAGSVGLPAGVGGTQKKDATVYRVCPRRASEEPTVPESPISHSPSLSLSTPLLSLVRSLSVSSNAQSTSPCVGTREQAPPILPDLLSKRPAFLKQPLPQRPTEPHGILENSKDSL